MSLKHAVVILSMILMIVMLSYAIALGVLGPIPSFEVRKLAQFYLRNTFNPLNRSLSAMTPEAVTAIVWDFRGFDTYFEVSVFYLAIIAVAMLFREISVSGKRPRGLSVIVKTVTKITAPMIVVVGFSIGFHGHLTPGGGFQGGSVVAVASALILVIFSLYTLYSRGVNTRRLLAIRGAALACMILTAYALLIHALISGAGKAFVFQNQEKPLSPLSMPYEIMGLIVSGTCSILNILDFTAVASGFTLLLIYLSIFEEDAKSVIEKEKEV